MGEWFEAWARNDPEMTKGAAVAAPFFFAVLYLYGPENQTLRQRMTLELQAR